MINFESLPWILSIFSIIVGFILIFIFVIFLRKSQEKARLNLSLNYVLYSVEIPRFRLIAEHKEERPRLMDEISTFENFLNSIAKLNKPIILEMATPHNEEEIFFYIAIPQKASEFVKKVIHSLWPGAQLVYQPLDYNPFHPAGFTNIALVKLRNHEFLPIRTYKEIAVGNVDPLETIWGAKILAVEEGAAYQLILIPESEKLNKKIYDVIKKLKEGESLKDALKGKGIGSVFKELLTTEKGKEKEKEEKAKPKPLEEEAIKLLTQKANKQLFRVNIRLVASSHNELRADEILGSMESLFGQFVLPGSNDFKIDRFPAHKNKKEIYKFSFRIFDKSKSSLLNTEEIASIFHFPTSYTKASRVHFLALRSVPPPVNLPEEGIILGDVVFPGVTKVARLTKEDRRRHFYIVGQTGTGKTNFLKSLFAQDLESGEGACFIDPHGDIAEEILNIIPKNRIDDVVYFSPGDTQRVMGLNILEYEKTRPEDKSFIINTLIEIIDKLYNLQMTGGPLFEQLLRNGLLLIMDNPDWGHTLLDFPRVLVDDDFRESLLKECKNYTVIEYWTKEAFLARGETSFENLVTWVTSKLNPFFANDFVRPIVAQPKTTIDFWKIMNEGKILIVNLSKGKLGETNAYLLGMLVVTKILLSAFRRTIIPEEERRDFYLYIDEFQNFAFKSIASILSEARKYRLALTMAHQYIKQLPEDLVNAVVGNVGSLMVFRVGEHDAEFFEKLFSPFFSKSDILNLPNYHAYVKILIHGFPSTPFAVKTRKAPSGDKAYGEKVKELSLLKYAKPKEEVEELIKEKYQRMVTIR
jgi:hypothetical protein